jgi:phosphoribosylaminoimidazole-succinocarboxamide synthase
MELQGLLYTGKAKSVYATAEPDTLCLEFRDDTTAFDGLKKAALMNKGSINLSISEYLLERLEQVGVPTHWLGRLSSTQALVKRCRMLPVESVVRNRAAGSLCKRLGVAQGALLSQPLYETFLKNDSLHDPMINLDHILLFSYATQEEAKAMREWSLIINRYLVEWFAEINLVLVDMKLEFGVDLAGQLCLADEISPDSCRLWDKKTHEPLDKDRFRQDLGGVVEAYEEVARRFGLSIS